MNGCAARACSSRARTPSAPRSPRTSRCWASRPSTSSTAANGVETARTFVAYQVRSSATGRVAVVSAENDGTRTTSVATLDDGRTLEIGRASGGGGGETDDPYASGGVFDVEADDVIDA